MRKAPIFGLVLTLLMTAPPAEAVEKSSAPMRWSMGAGTDAGQLVEHGQMRARATAKGVRMSVVTDGLVAASQLPGTADEVLGYVQWRLESNASPVPGVAPEQIAGGSGLLTNPLGAEYHAVLFDHGPYDPERYGDDRLTMHDGGCHIGDDNVCMPLQAAGAMGIFPWSD